PRPRLGRWRRLFLLRLRDPGASPRTGARRRRCIVLATPARGGRGLNLFMLDLAGAGAAVQHFVGRFAVDRAIVLADKRARFQRGRAFDIVGRTDTAARWRDEAALDRLRHALGVKEGNQRLADAQLEDGVDGLELLVGPEGVGGGLHRLL